MPTEMPADAQQSRQNWSWHTFLIARLLLLLPTACWLLATATTPLITRLRAKPTASNAVTTASLLSGKGTTAQLFFRLTSAMGVTMGVTMRVPPQQGTVCWRQVLEKGDANCAVLGLQGQLLLLRVCALKQGALLDSHALSHLDQRFQGFQTASNVTQASWW